MPGATVHCLFRVAAGRETEFVALLRRNWPVLNRLGFLTDDGPQHYRGVEDGGGVIYIEIVTWADESAAERAHLNPDVDALWEAMTTLTEARNGKPPMEFVDVTKLDLS